MVLNESFFSITPESFNTITVDPPAGEVVKCISTAFKSESFTDDSVDFIAPASYAEMTVVFPT